MTIKQEFDDKSIWVMAPDDGKTPERKAFESAVRRVKYQAKRRTKIVCRNVYSELRFRVRVLVWTVKGWVK